ncbi:MAG: hypothetical protein H6686_02855 [Fibrobacteria bacterium]|nr:hypothetical protein [Fibrobacteria bacterium]
MSQTIPFLLRSLIKRIPGYYAAHDRKSAERQAREYEAWLQAGSPVPPPHMAKRLVLQSLAKLHGLSILVETGTYYGEMIAALRDDFETIYTIELAKPLHRLAQRRFKNSPHIHVIQGDSGQQLQQILPRLDKPTLFWLDGHYSSGVTAKGESDTPILQELDHILNAPDLGHVLVIDDARDFGTDPGYPTLETVREFVLSRRPSMEFHVETDSIRFTPKIG